MNRRTFLTATAVLALSAALPLGAEPLPKLVVYKDPNCGCCGAWVDHMRAAGFQAEVIETGSVNQMKAKLGVPAELASCHTARLGDYVLEGHVPADAVLRLLREKPEAAGLAVPRMPVGSPGMEVEGHEPDTYEVVLFGKDGTQVFGTYRGDMRA